MRYHIRITFLVCASLLSHYCAAQAVNGNEIITGAEQTRKYFSYLEGKNIAVLANHTSIIGSIHLVDSLVASGIKVQKIFAPEHGFYGKSPAGVNVGDGVHSSTGLEIISLYGDKTIPTEEDLSDVDIVLFDLQDVGCRFSAPAKVLGNIMYACAKNKKELLILDRPNPNGYLVDGPVLDMELKSGIGQYPIPIAHGLTIAELAWMLNGERWLKDSAICKLKIIPVRNYSHGLSYDLPIPPSPNLNTQQAVMLYPSICLFEGTRLSCGKGTLFPYTVIGSPELQGKHKFSFTPQSLLGMSTSPIYKEQQCFGLDLRNYRVAKLKKSKRIKLQWIIAFYKAYPEKEMFFNTETDKQIGNIDLLVGDRNFKTQIKSGKTVEQIRKSWEPELSNYKKIRKKYLLYP